MSGTSSKAQRVNFWLSNEAYDKILKALEHPANCNENSVGKYCKAVIERHAFRHDKRRYKKGVN